MSERQEGYRPLAIALVLIAILAAAVTLILTGHEQWVLWAFILSLIVFT
jgi:uncharacterized membrane protein YjjP (DUF1212 family)